VKYVGTAEAAKALGISRVAVLKKIATGQIKAIKIGRVWAVEESSLPTVGRTPTASDRKRIAAAVRKSVDEYGEALRKLGSE